MAGEGGSPRGAARRLAPGLWLIDLHFGGLWGVIAAYLLADETGRRDDLALIETGPASTVDALWDAIAATGHDPRRLRQIMVTHIHLDHAGAAGQLAARVPEARVLVHEAGARHLADPSRLLASAALIYKERMESLWGNTVPVPGNRIQVVADDEQIDAPGQTLRAVYTPGHARHHVAFHDARGAAVYTGDVGGIRLQGSTYVRPPTPPPDIDVAAWDRSIARLRATNAQTLYLTHFGPATGVPAHLDELARRLHAWTAFVRRARDRGDAPDEIVALLSADEDPQISAVSAGADAVRAYEVAGAYEMNVAGLLRYLSKSAG
jgi:glyoxylase-like metal-dependent hydrolase (beta-lactamase superfamily II)